MARPVFLAGRKIDLCVLEPGGDFSTYACWVNDQETTQFMSTGNLPTTEQQLRDYVEGFAGSGGCLLGIFDKKTARHVGNIALHTIDQQNRRAEIGIMIGDPDARGQGYGAEAVRLVCRHAFMRLNLNKVTAGVILDNVASLKLFERAGFRREGLVREHFYLDGRYLGCVRLGLLRSEFDGAGGA